MDEAKWLASSDPAAMLASLRSSYTAVYHSCSDRKLRLFADACRELGFCAMRFENVVEDADHMARCVKDEPNRHHVPGVVHLLREIIGNPFCTPWLTVHGIPPEPLRSRRQWISYDWLTPTVLSIASRIYDERDFAAMPILADAMEDVGCDNEEILRHCRGQEAYIDKYQPGNWHPLRGPHVRGCWCLDLILSKE